MSLAANLASETWGRDTIVKIGTERADETFMMGMGGSYLHRQQMKALHSSQRSAAAETISQRKRQRSEFQNLEDELAKLRLITEAMWELTSEVTGLSIEQLARRIEEVDMDDGRADGRKVHPMLNCTSCHAKVDHSSKICTYCGVPAPARSPFAF